MKAKMICLYKDIPKFKSSWNVQCAPILINNNYYLPLGWEDELNKLEIEFTVQIVEWEDEEII